MKKPEKKITATMNTTPATMPTHTRIEFDRFRLSSYGDADSKARRSVAAVVCSFPDSRGSVILESSPALEPNR